MDAMLISQHIMVLCSRPQIPNNDYEISSISFDVRCVENSLAVFWYGPRATRNAFLVSHSRDEPPCGDRRGKIAHQKLSLCMTLQENL